MEDIDQPRVVKNSDRQIIDDLTWLGLDWDGPIAFQSDNLQRYQAYLDQLIEADLVYPCFCSRKELREICSAPHSKEPVYPGKCANLSLEQQAIRSQDKTPSLRLRVENQNVSYLDGVLGQQTQNLKHEVGDFVIKRADGLFAYQFAVTIDDLDQGITHVVRGADLSSSTARQLFLAQLLKPNTKPIEYWHVPLKLDQDGKRMAKRDGSLSLQQLKNQGISADTVIGQFAFELGLVPQNKAISAHDLLDTLSFEQFGRAISCK